MTRYWRAWFGAGYSDVDLAMVLLNATVLCASVVFTYLAARRLGRPPVAYAVGVLCFVFIGVSPWIGVVYSDTVAVLPIAVLAYLIALLRDTKSAIGRTAEWTAIGLVGAVGYAIKPTVVFAVLAVVVVALLDRALRRWSRRDVALRAAAVLGMGLGVVAGVQVTEAVIDHTGLSPPSGRTDAAIPLSHFLMTGASERPGFYNHYYRRLSGRGLRTHPLDPPGPERERHGYEEYRRGSTRWARSATPVPQQEGHLDAG